MIERDPARARAAHLLRRASMAPNADRVEDLVGGSFSAAIDSVLGADQDISPPPSTEDGSDVIVWWLEQMTSAGTGLVDRMAWFWHSHLTTSAEKAGSELIAVQLHLLRTEGLGNYRTLLHRFVVDGALLQYLDGAGSLASNPNENLARELMELFTIGPGHYDQDDVRAAARALAGWVVDDGRVAFHRDRAFIAPLLFLTVQDDWDTERLVDRLCDHPATAVNVASKLFFELAGRRLTPERAEELGRWWQDHDLEILPLVDRILRSEDFSDLQSTRPRTGLEWWCGVTATLERPIDDMWALYELGQSPYRPPSPAGWPRDDRWLRPGSMLARSGHVFGLPFDDLVGERPWSVDDILDRCCLYRVSEATMAALELTSEADLSPEARRHLRWSVALSSPEFNRT